MLLFPLIWKQWKRSERHPLQNTFCRHFLCSQEQWISDWPRQLCNANSDNDTLHRAEACWTHSRKLKLLIFFDALINTVAGWFVDDELDRIWKEAAVAYPGMYLKRMRKTTNISLKTANALAHSCYRCSNMSGTRLKRRQNSSVSTDLSSINL